MKKSAHRVVIDFLPESVERYRKGYAVVAIDVIRATTTLATAMALGRRCYVASSVNGALTRAAELERPLVAGEAAGEMPDEGFDMTNSPAALVLRSDIERPLVLVSSNGTRLVYNAGLCEAAYVACFRNYDAVASYIAGRHRRIAVIGAGTRGEFREEDQMCCAWIAERLMKLGYAPQDARTVEMVARWSGAPPEACRSSKSVAYLTRSNQLQDLDFILSHVNDLDIAFTLDADEVITAEDSKPPRRSQSIAANNKRGLLNGRRSSV